MKKVQLFLMLFMLAIAFSSCDSEKIEKETEQVKTLEDYYRSNPEMFVWNEYFKSWQYIIKSESLPTPGTYNPPVYLTDLNSGSCSVSYYMPATNTYSSPQNIWCCDVPGVEGYYFNGDRDEWPYRYSGYYDCNQ